MTESVLGVVTDNKPAKFANDMFWRYLYLDFLVSTVGCDVSGKFPSKSSFNFEVVLDLVHLGH
jgi:hypothetical protein